MTKFIRLNNIIINTLYIINIDILPKKYTIFMSNNYFSGLFLLGSGSIESFDNKIEICKINHPCDYQIIKEWINQIK
jgi:hypothetical protein